jgi:hypothetical protein
MSFTLTLTDLLIAAGIVVPIGVAGLYWCVRMAIQAEVGRLERRVLEDYRTKATCREIREECERHRHELAAAAAPATQPSRARH